jgi:hypothetical protein
MRKFMIMLFLGFALTGCSTDDDVSTVSYEFAEITESDFPEFFEAGRTYNFEITYKLPSTCHIFLGFDGGKADFSSNEFFIYAWTSINSAKTNCNSTNEEDLIFKNTITDFSISPNAGEDEKFIFHLWTGTDVEGNPIFNTVEVPIGVLDES